MRIPGGGGGFPEAVICNFLLNAGAIRMVDFGVYAVASEEIIFESFDGDAVVLDVGTGRYFGFSDLGSCAWEALSSDVPASAILGLGSNGNGVSTAGLEAFIEQMLEFGLLTAAPGEPGKAVSPLLAERFALAKGPLGVERHDELADLIQADPIHDVDKAMGWPVRETA